MARLHLVLLALVMFLLARNACGSYPWHTSDIGMYQLYPDPSDTECYVEQVSVLSVIGCAIHANYKESCGFLFVQRNNSCHICLPIGATDDVSLTALPSDGQFYIKGRSFNSMCAGVLSISNLALV